MSQPDICHEAACGAVVDPSPVGLLVALRRIALADRYDSTPDVVAVARMLHSSAVDRAIVGVRRPDRLDPLLVAPGLELTDEGLAEIARRQRR